MWGSIVVDFFYLKKIKVKNLYANFVKLEAVRDKRLYELMKDLWNILFLGFFFASFILTYSEEFSNEIPRSQLLEFDNS